MPAAASAAAPIASGASGDVPAGPATPSNDDADDLVEPDAIGAILTDPPSHGPVTSVPPLPPQRVPAFGGSGAPPAPLPASDVGLPAPALPRLRTPLTVVGLAAAGLLVLVVAVLLATGDDEDEASSAVPSATPSTSAPLRPPEPRGCRLAVPAAKLAATVERGVSPNLLALGNGRVAVGFAAKPTQASGVVVDLRTLETQSTFDEPGTSAVRNVAALEGGAFQVTREDDPLASPRSLDGQTATLLGFTKEGLARKRGRAAPEVLWKTQVDRVTEPRSARAGDAGYLVVFRRGGLGGAVVAGWLGPEASRKSELDVLAAGVRYVGTPVAAAHPRSALVAFAGRDDESADWRIRLARAELGQPPRSVTDFALPEGGPGGGAIAPWLAPLEDGRWLLQWTEGGVGNYQVRVQALTSDLVPVGVPVLASPRGASAGQGALLVAERRVLSVFVLTVGGYDELWGAALECR